MILQKGTNSVGLVICIFKNNCSQTIGQTFFKTIKRILVEINVPVKWLQSL